MPMPNWRNVKNQLIVVLLVLTFFGVGRFGFLATVGQAAFSIMVAAGIDFAIAYFLRKRPFLPTSAIISGLIVALVFTPGSPLFALALADVVAILGKNFLRFEFFGKRRHVFNPAASGIFVASLLFPSFVNGWWGDLYPYLTLLLGGYIVWKQRRVTQVAFFIVSSALFSLIALFLNHQAIGLLGAYLLTTFTVFFVTVMLIEPQTTPLVPKGRYIFSILCAAFIFLTGFFHFLPNPLVTALLAADLLVPVVNKLTIPQSLLAATSIAQTPEEGG